MPAKTPRQRRAAGMALAAKKGKVAKSKLKGPARSMAKSMTKTELKKMASKPKKK
jgi:hypothetical protein